MYLIIFISTTYITFPMYLFSKFLLSFSKLTRPPVFFQRQFWAPICQGFVNVYPVLDNLS
jgi:hypothetical protein